jgi:UDP-glucose 4-epimerase
MSTTMHERMEPCQFSGKKVLVTGASGFIGLHLCRRLSGLGARVHAVSRTFREDEEGKLRWWQGDLGDRETAYNLFRIIQPEVTFHLASHVTGGRDIGFVVPTLHSNLVTTVNLLAAATEIGCDRVIIAGSLEEPAAGDMAAIPCSPYAAAKWASSAYARMFHALYCTPVVIARLFMVYGPGQQDLRKLVPYVTLSLLRGQAPELSKGERLVDWIYVEDVVDGLLSATQAPYIEGSVIDLGSGILVPIRTVVKQLVELVGTKIEPLFGALPDRPFEQVRVADVAQAAAKIGWRPATPLAVGLQRTVEWYREHRGGAKI